METDIKCLECGRGTLRFNLGPVYYSPEIEHDNFLIAKAVICPKCGKDVSNKRFAVNGPRVMGSIFTANVCVSIRETVPPHLRGIVLFHPSQYADIRRKAKAIPKLVRIFSKKGLAEEYV